MCWWGGLALLILPVTITRVSVKRPKTNLGISLVGAVIECSNFVDEVRFKWIEAIDFLKLSLDS